MQLADATVVIVGLGALGCPAALHLAAAGVGRLILVDPDRIELSNLHRQTLYGTSSLGRFKVEVAAQRLGDRFPAVRVDPCPVALTAATLPAVFAEAQFAIDATDGAETKFLINDGAVRGRHPFAHAGVLGFAGQLLAVLPGTSACLRCVFPEPPAPGEVPSCREAGVVGGIAGVIGALQAMEAIKYLTGRGQLAIDTLVSYDALTGRWRRVPLSRNPDCPVCAGVQPSGGAVLDAAAPARYGN